MHTNNLVTVLMSVRNGEPYIKEAVNSILNQSYDKFDFLILDNASTDNTRSIINEFKDTRIKLVELSKDIGQSSALNKGLGIINTKYVARMDADDISLRDRLEKQIHYLESHPNVGVLGCHVKIVNQDLSSSKPVRKRPLTNFENHWRLLYSTSIMHSSVIFHHRLVKEHGAYDIKYVPAEDYELWSRLSHFTEINQLTDILVLLRKHEARSSVKNSSEQNEVTLKIRRENITNLLINYVDSQKIMNLLQYLSGKRNGSKQWWLNVNYTMMKMYAHFCYGKNMTKKELNWISKDLNKIFIDVPIGYKLTGFKYIFESIHSGRYNYYHLFNLISNGFFTPLLNNVRLRKSQYINFF